MDPIPTAPGALRILHVFRAPVGGLFRHVADLVRLQAAAGHAVGLVCDSGTGGARAERALDDLGPTLSLGVLRVPMRRNPHWSDRDALRAVSRRARVLDVSVLHGHGAKGGAYARLARASAIRAYTPHGGSYNHRPGSALHRIYMAAEALLARRTDLFLFESAYVAGRHRVHVGGPERLTRIVHNGLAPAEFAPVAPARDRHDLLYVGELREAKGLPVLLDALALMRAGGRTLRLLVVGAGPDEGRLRAAAVRLGLSDCVAFEPAQAIRSVFARGGVLVMPSLSESLPYVALEALAAGQPLVATDVGGIPEIFGPAAGDLVPARDPAALACAIGRVLDEAPAVRAARIGALRDSVRQRFSLERMGDEVRAGYAAALRATDLRRPETAGLRLGGAA